MLSPKPTYQSPAGGVSTPHAPAASLLEQSVALTQAPGWSESLRPRSTGFSPAEISGLVQREIVERHAEEAAFLWLLRDRAVSAPHYRLSDLAELDERVEAHLDGLRVAGEHGWQVCRQGLATGEPGEAFAAGVLAAERGATDRFELVLALCRESPACARALVSALGWMNCQPVRQTLDFLLASESAVERRIGIRGFAAQRIDPGPALPPLLSDLDVGVRASALWTAGELGRVDLLPLVMSSLQAPERETRFRAAWSAARLGDRSKLTIAVLQELAAEPSPFQEAAWSLYLRVIAPSEAAAAIRSVWQNPSRLRLAALGIGALGLPELMPALIEMQHVEPVARVAGEAFSMTTGVDLAYADLDRAAPPNWEATNSDDPDDDLPWPDGERVALYWQRVRGEFVDGCRYLGGREMTAHGLSQVLRSGFQRQRAAAALEGGLLQPAMPLFAVRESGKFQQRRLAAWTL